MHLRERREVCEPLLLYTHIVAPGVAKGGSVFPAGSDRMTVPLPQKLRATSREFVLHVAMPGCSWRFINAAVRREWSCR